MTACSLIAMARTAAGLSRGGLEGSGQSHVTFLHLAHRLGFAPLNQICSHLSHFHACTVSTLMH